MKATASLLAAAVLSILSLSAHATAINPLTDGYAISINGQSLTTNNLLLDLNAGAPANSFVFSDGLTQYVFAEVSVTNAASALSVTELCLTANILTGCKASTISVSNAKVGAVSLSANVNASLTAAAGANLGVINLAAVADLGSDSATVAYAALSSGSGNSPVPEPGTLGLMATGLLAAAGTLRQKFVA